MSEFIPKSERGKRLVVSDSYLHDLPFLTVEAYLKWYTLYVVDPVARTVRSLGAEEYPGDAGDHWNDHCLIPSSYRKIAEHLGVEAIDIVYECIVGRYLEDICDGDPRGLADRLDPEGV